MTKFTQAIIYLTKMIETIKTCSAPQLAVVSLIVVSLVVVVVLPVAAVAF